MKDIVFKAPIEGFQYLRKDAFNYYKILSGATRTVPENTEMFVTEEIEVIGTLAVEGRVTVWSAEDLVTQNVVTVTAATYTQQYADEIIVLDASSNNIVLTLLEASNYELGKEIKLIVKEEGTYSVTVVAGGSDTISDDPSVQLYKYEVLELNKIADTEWVG